MKVDIKKLQAKHNARKKMRQERGKKNMKSLQGGHIK